MDTHTHTPTVILHWYVEASERDICAFYYLSQLFWHIVPTCRNCTFTITSSSNSIEGQANSKKNINNSKVLTQRFFTVLQDIIL